jgi:formate dehydrogenase major subunit
MDLNRREFIKLSGATLSGIAFGTMGFDLTPIEAYASTLRIQNADQTTTICPYCAVGCGILVHTIQGKVVNTEGDPDHPINEGSLCPKGMSLYQLSHNNPNRLTTPLYRAPYATEWKEVSWDFTLDKIAANIKKTRDESFETTNAAGQEVNRTMGMASVGSAALDNEECYLYQKFLRSLGMVFIEHQARI